MVGLVYRPSSLDRTYYSNYSVNPQTVITNYCSKGLIIRRTIYPPTDLTQK